MEYSPREIEKKWRQWWNDHAVYQVSNDSDRPKFYVLDMFPYPSGAGLHVGHPLGYIASDIVSRYKRMSGYNVLHPMGYDAFGLPAEQYALQTGVHPAKSTATNIARYRQQLDNLGFSFDWSREVQTCDPKYYKWTQWIFLQLYGHWYDKKADSARPIPDLIAIFEREGNANASAATSMETTFSAADWRGFSNKEKDEVLMNYRLAFRKTTYVWWCEGLGTVLANDEVKDGVSERGGHPVERKPMLQWSLRITAYAERLLNDLNEVDFSDSMKKMQSNWIGRSQGAQMFFELAPITPPAPPRGEYASSGDLSGASMSKISSPTQTPSSVVPPSRGGRGGDAGQLEIFTTRPDTIFGATFMVLAPEHDLVSQITTPEQRQTIEEYRTYVNSRSERDRMSETKEVSGAFTGAYALNPFNGEKIPIWIAEYVLKDYGTGAIMAVPADDERDMRFAKKYDLPIVEIIDKSRYPGATMDDKVGRMINSDFLNGMECLDAIEETLQRIEKMGIGQRRINYKLRDAIYSRQRYWGEPFPIVYDEEGVSHPMPIEDLPLELPELEDFKPASGAKSPLARVEDWVYLPNFLHRETDTMPGFAGSSWYFLRYMDPGNDAEFASQKALNYWQDVDLYVGGTEHAVGHLMYSRLWHKFLYDKGLVPTKEPYKKLLNQGMIQGKSAIMEVLMEGGRTLELHVPVALIDENWRLYLDKFEVAKASDNRFEQVSPGSNVELKFDENHKPYMQLSQAVEKMSKSLFNVINPDEVVEQHGADCFRMYEMFLGPVEQAKPWDTKGISGVSGFLRKFWSLFFDSQWNFKVSDEAPTKDELRALHTLLKKIAEDIERFSFNTCVSGFMICTNELRSLNCNKRAILEPLVRALSPFAPHLAEELWHRLGNENTVCLAEYPVHDEAHLVLDSVMYPVSINGKKRDVVELPAGLPVADLEKLALGLESIQKWTEGLSIKKVIVVPGRMINIVV